MKLIERKEYLDKMVRVIGYQGDHRGTSKRQVEAVRGL